MTTLTLHSAIHILHRNDGFIQLGIHPETAVLIPTSAQCVLTLLSGRHTRTEIVDKAVALDCNAVEVSALLDLLLRNNLIVEIGPSSLRDTLSEQHRINSMRASHIDAQSVEHRITTEISIYGAGRLGTVVALLLSSSGFARVKVFDSKLVTLADVSPWGASRIDVGLRRDQVVATLLSRMHPGTSLRSLHSSHESVQRLAIVCPDQPADWPWFNPSSTDAFIANGTPHMLVGATAHTAAISSVITPDLTSCIRCEYHALTDRDSQWPQISLQLSTRPQQDLAAMPLLLLTAIEVVSQVERWRSQSWQAESTWTYRLWPTLERRVTSWGFHPGCGCQWNRELVA